MWYFTDFAYDKATKFAITSPLGPLSLRPTSHKGTWQFLLKRQLWDEGYKNVRLLGDEPWAPDEVLVLDYGMEFDGEHFNLFGGLTDKVCDRLAKLKSHPNHILAAGMANPDFSKFLRGRKEQVAGFDKEGWCEWYDSKPLKFAHFDRVAMKSQLVLGDSHALSQWRPRSEMSRNDGLTLYGALKRGLRSLVPSHISELLVYFGNIDIRHHLCRQSDPVEATRQLVTDYCSQLAKLKSEGVNCSVVAPLYIEDVSRKLPKTGYYKGEPFHGSWEQREWLRQYMTAILFHQCKFNGFGFVSHPASYLTPEGKLSFDVMEKPQSVHLRRDAYPFDLETGERRF